MEIVIKDFKGYQEARNPDPNGCQDIKNLDPRGNIEGDLILKPAIVEYLDLPVSSGNYTKVDDLGFEHLYTTLISGNKELKIAIQKGTVAKSDPSASIASKNIIAIFNYPSYVGGVWINQWNWLNAIEIARITQVDTSSIYEISYADDSLFTTPVVYNVTKNQYGKVLHIVGGASARYYMDTAGWTIGDTVILMENYIPLTNLEENYNSTLYQISTHQLINDLRIGFGGYVNRLGLGVGYRKKYFNLHSVVANTGELTNARGLDALIIDPFNNTTDNATFKITTALPTISISEGNVFPYAEFKSIYVQMTVVLDGYQEFIIPPDSTLRQIGDDYAYAMKGSEVAGQLTNYLLVTPYIRFSTMNKRITSVRIYLAQGLGETDSYVRSSSYCLVKEIEVSNYSASKNVWVLNNDGYLVGATLNITYADWLSRGETLQVNIGHKLTTDYLQSWDQALVAGGRVNYLNGYVDQRYVNQILYSPVSGTGANMYDVGIASMYSAAESRDSDDIVGMELLGNLDIVILKQNSIQKLDPGTDSIVTIVNGVGCVARKGVVNFRDKIIFPSRYGVYIYDGVSIRNITDKQLATIYDNIASKELIIATKDPLKNTYRFTHESFLYRDYMYVDGKGWFTNLSESAGWGRIDCYSLSPETNVVRFSTNNGTISEITNTRGVAIGGVALYTADDTIGWKSIEYNIADIEQLKDDERFFLQNFWIHYKSSVALVADFCIDGTLISNAQVPIAASLTDTILTQKLKRSLVGKKFYIQLTTTATGLGVYSGTGTVGIEIHEIGIELSGMKIGRWRR